jgi:hypothetical protein
MTQGYEMYAVPQPTQPMYMMVSVCVYIAVYVVLIIINK